METMPTRFIAQFNGTASGPARAASATLTWPNNMSTSTPPVFVTQIAGNHTFR